MKDSEPIRLILNKVKHSRSGEGFSFRCPAHVDERNSGYVKAEGNAILKCFAACSRKTVCEALGLTESDLYVKKSSHFSSSQTVARYRYFDEAGKLLYEHRRLADADGKKTFLYCRQDESGNSLWTLYGGWFELKGRTWKRVEGASDPNTKPKPSARWFDESKRALYRLGALKKAASGSPVLYCEGEKDVENAETLGVLATTAGSASDWRAEFADDLQGFDLVIIPDNDAAGRKCAAKVASDCHKKAARIRILELPELGKGGDLSDWIAAGGTREKLLELVSKAPDFDPAGGFCIGVHVCTPIQNPEIDVSSLQEIEDDDPPVSDDPKREAYLRQVTRNAAKVLEACAIIMRLLGFHRDHTRLLTALIAIGRDRLKYFNAYHAAIRERYAAIGEASSIDTVKRDLKALREEQAALGVVLLRYSPGSKDLVTGKSYPCQFQNRLLRYALEAINISIDTRPDFKSSRKAIEAACQQVVKDIDRVDSVPAKAKRKKAVTVEALEAKLFSLQEQLVETMLADGWTADEMEAEIDLQHRRFYDQLKKVHKRQTSIALAPAQIEEVIHI
jgi:hypothetical protein